MSTIVPTLEEILVRAIYNFSANVKSGRAGEPKPINLPKPLPPSVFLGKCYLMFGLYSRATDKM
ncbi:hypothetical protein A3K70_00900 [Candidatus Bathyarchaeota archaeon RBG_16_48_13]|nr:MAG: hypothetical protein A3K70_00900 [Candidatus Bathyarchaeota archaeon RBG_16_48_13]